MKKNIIWSLLFYFMASNAFSIESEKCTSVRFSDVGWTDISTTTSLASIVLEALGYHTDIKLLSVPITFKSLKDKTIDVFLGDWIPSMSSHIKPYILDKSIEVVHENLKGAKYTLAVNAAAVSLGIKDFKDISLHKDALKGNIYGIDPGNDGNTHILDMIAKNKFNLKGFHLVESSEQGMLAQVMRSERDNQPIVFLAWEPHPMNINFKINYLTGGDEYFGPNFGEAIVYTVVRSDYLKECPNVAQFLRNLTFSLKMENEIMDEILNKKKDPKIAGKKWLSNNTKILDSWLSGVVDIKGNYDLASVKKKLQD
ncbi:choline ABC transporter substrate-binding protein [Liberibacter crescens]